MTTLESRISERLAEFALKRREDVPRLLARAAELQASMDALNKGLEPDNYFALRDQLKQLLDEAEQWSEANEVQYMLDSIPFIQKYTSAGEVAAAAAETTAVMKTPSTAPHSLASTSHGPPPPLPAAAALDNFVTVTHKQPRNEVFQEYLLQMEGRSDTAFLNQLNRASRSERDAEYLCARCNEPKMYFSREASLVCPSCGISCSHIELGEANLTYTEHLEMQPRTQYCYKRMNHFVEWLTAIQGLETTDVPREVLDAVRSELKKHRVSTREEITADKVRFFLKKLGLNKWYEHKYIICAQLSGVPPPRFPPSLEDRLKQMFKEIQGPFIKHCPPNRKNFFSYEYVFYKFCELLGEDKYLQHFRLLKSSEKLHGQDKMWRNVCLELNWEFIPTV